MPPADQGLPKREPGLWLQGTIISRFSETKQRDDGSTRYITKYRIAVGDAAFNVSVWSDEPTLDLEPVGSYAEFRCNPRAFVTQQGSAMFTLDGTR